MRTLILDEEWKMHALLIQGNNTSYQKQNGKHTIAPHPASFLLK